MPGSSGYGSPRANPRNTSAPAQLPSTPAVAPDHQQAPWEPTIGTSPSKPEQIAVAQYTAVYGGSPTISDSADQSPNLPSYSIPNLALAYSRAPDLVPTKPSSQPGGGGAPSTDASGVIDNSPIFHIDLSALMGAENSILTTLSGAIAAYDGLQPVVQDAIASDSLFGQNVGWQQRMRNHDSGPQPYLTTWDDLDAEGTAFANSINPTMEYIMQVAGGLFEIWGSFAALINNTGQMYTYTDNSTALNMD
jgi:hypothetical protein